MQMSRKWLGVLSDFSSQEIRQIIYLCDLWGLERPKEAGERHAKDN